MTLERTSAATNPLLPNGRHLADIVAEVTDSVDARLTRVLTGSVAGVSSSELLPLLSGGKLLRSRLTILIAHTLGTPDPQYLRRACVAVELIHTASLVHDDIIDDSTTRRGLPTVQRSTSPATAILLGDLLISLAFEEMSPLGADASAALSRAFTQLCLGQLSESELTWGAEAQPSMEQYARRKTGGLFGAAVELAALACGVSASAAAEFRTSGEVLGVAFQLADDLIDVQDDLAELDKDHGADLRNGIPTLPLWHAYRTLQTSGAPGSPGSQGSNFNWRDGLAREAGSPAARSVTLRRIAELVEVTRSGFPEIEHPELLDTAVAVVLGALPEYRLQDLKGTEA